LGPVRLNVVVGVVGVVLLVVGMVVLVEGVGIVGIVIVPGVPLLSNPETKVPMKPASWKYYQVMTPAFQPNSLYP